MQQTHRQRVALVSTGSELITGDIQDTNAPYFAQQLTAHGMTVGEHMIVSDEQADIEAAIEFLRTRHGAVIICGGLGPTSDDRTRYALAHVINEPLQFNDSVWHHIQQWLNAKGIPAHDDNRRQAFFPENCTIIQNRQGTAPGCRVQLAEGPLLFMLPGPPKECCPMFDEHVLPDLEAQGFASATKIEVLKFMGVIEAEIASHVDALAKHYQLKPAYRVNYPYLDVKVPVSLDDIQAFTDFTKALKRQYPGHWVSSSRQDALALLNQALNRAPLSVAVIDPLTEGRLNHYLWSFATVTMVPSYQADLCIEATGFCELQSPDTYGGRTQLQCRVAYQGTTLTKRLIVPKRGDDLSYYALHFMSFALYEALTART